MIGMRTRFRLERCGQNRHRILFLLSTRSGSPCKGRLARAVVSVAVDEYTVGVFFQDGVGPLRRGSRVTVKILIADDEPDLELLIRQRFRKEIRDKLYEFVFARDGTEALEKLKQDPEILLVLSDINMPNMDGLTLVGKIKEENPLIQPVIVSAYGDMINIRTAMNRGAFDFLTKPIDFQDFEITLTKTMHQAELM